MNGQTFLEKMNWRCSIKSFDTQKKLSPDQLNTLLESLRLTASSFGLQPWKFLVVTNPEIRKTLVSHAWNQSQVSDASHLIVLCAYREFGDKEIDLFVDDIVKTREVTKESLAGFEKMVKGFVGRMSPEAKNAWLKDQVYIALGNLLTTCAVLDIDACPMEGFSAKDFDQVLGLEAKNLRSIALCPVGFRNPEDKYSKIKKVRFSQKELVEFI